MRAPCLLLVCLLLGTAGCRRAETAGPAADSVVVTLRTALVAAEAQPTVIEVPATVRPAQRAVVEPQSMQRWRLAVFAMPRW